MLLNKLISAPITIPAPPQPTQFTEVVGSRSSYLENTTFSPVNEHGCFEFDRIIKAGEILKRGRKTSVSQE